MRSLAAILLLLAVAACGGASDGTTAPEDVDRAAWKADLLELDPTSDPDMAAIEKLAREDCKTSVDDLALRFSLSGSQPDVTRVGMKHVCPGEVGKVDEALLQVQDAGKSVDEACDTDPALRTEEQAQLAEAMDCDAP